MKADSWRIPFPDELLLEEWENAWMLYHRGTGETHLLDALTVEILDILRSNTLSTPTLAEELARRCQRSADAEWQARIGTTLERLEFLSLVERQR